jgi:L-fuculose-phosphate aldolase
MTMPTLDPTTAAELVDACRVLADHGHEDKTLGHLSYRDPHGRGLWLKRAGIGLGEKRNADDFVLIGFEGEVISGSGDRHIEWPIHAGVLCHRPDVDYVLHSHAHACVLFSALEEPLPLVGNECVLFVDGVPRFTDTSDLIRTPELGDRVARTLGTGRVTLLRSHGIVVAAATVWDLVLTAIYLEATAESALALFATGRPFVEVDREDARAKAMRTVTPDVLAGFWEYYRRRLPRARN